MIAPFVQSLNIGTPRKEIFAEKEVITGICKKAVSRAIFLSKHGFTGDGSHNLKHHGGRDKAVCFYDFSHYEFWTRELGIAMPEAAFGENITLSGLSEDDVCIGDIYQIGTATVEISQPRQPCNILAARFGRADLSKLVIETGYTGWYSRVLVEGEVRRGDTMTVIKKEPQQVSITQANRTFHHDKKNSSALERLLAVAALSGSWQKSLREQLGRSP